MVGLRVMVQSGTIVLSDQVGWWRLEASAKLDDVIKLIVSLKDMTAEQSNTIASRNGMIKSIANELSD
jgi:hypothetical protein